MPKTIAEVPTAHAAKYLQQLCKHWAHKLETELDGDRGIVRFPDGVTHMQAGADVLTVSIEARSQEVVERLKEVVARHLDRFAFREAPLPFAWQDG